jgi:glycosyltransferase involved in cell wall biosynthesis
VLLCPAAGSQPKLKRIEARVVGPVWLSLHLWEQLFLPLECRGSTLLCLAGSAPAFKTGQVCMIHDAAIYDTPEAYRPAFVAWYRFLFKRLASTARLIVTVSDFSKERLMRGLGMSADKIAVVRNGADHLDACVAEPSALEALGLRAGRYFIVVGSSNPNKNHRVAVQAFLALAPSNDMQLVVVGDGNDAVFAADVEAGGRGRVVLAGRQSDRQLKGLYAAAIALVFPSYYEGSGLPPLEAMSCGCPVIASNRAAIPEICGDGVLYADPDSVIDIADAMSRLIVEPTFRGRVIHNGSRRAREFNWDRAAGTLLSHLAAVGLIGHLEQ